MPEVVNNKIQKELSAGRIQGPFLIPPYKEYVVSPIGLQPKKQPGEFRVIHHLSYPHGRSINSGIPCELSSVNYGTIGQAIKFIKMLGRGCFLSKTDVKSAFRLIPIRPDEYHLLGFKWQGMFYFDACLPMGCSTSCAIFEEFSTSLEWMAINSLKITAMVHILDDFLIISKNKISANQDLDRFLTACHDINIPMAPEKTQGPSTCLSFAGIELDTVHMVARLPLDKLHKCEGLIDSFRKSVTLREIQSLVGILNFACTVIVPGRAFLRRLIDLTKGVKNKFHHIRLTKAIKKDLMVWKGFLQEFNGKSFFLEESLSTPDFHLFTDSAGSLGFGAILGNKWFYGAWPNQKIREMNITRLELYPIVVAVNVWACHLENKTISIRTDNEALVYIINKQTSRDSGVMGLIRPLVSQCLKHNILLKASHIKGSSNTYADMLSRLQVSEFLQAVPTADRVPHMVPIGQKPEVLLKT